MELAPATNDRPLRRWQQILFLAIFVPSFLVVGIGCAVIAEIVVRLVHLSLVYGIQPVVEGRVYFASTKPELIVSNGDHLTGINHGWHFIAIPALWLSLWFGLIFLAMRFAGRLLKWKWRMRE